MSNKQPKFVATWFEYCGVGGTVQEAFDSLREHYDCELTDVSFYKIDKQVEVVLSVVPLINVEG